MMYVALLGLAAFSSFLLFLVQPMYVRLLLPVLGGAPMVWSTALVFFQGTLLLGYAYASWHQAKLTSRTGALIHAIMLGISVLWLPLALPENAANPPSSGQWLWLLTVLGSGLLGPLLCLSAHSSLLSSWAANRYTDKQTYRLYIASNIGSLAALLSYPFVLEPSTDLTSQLGLWSWAYGGLILAMGLALTQRAAMTSSRSISAQNSEQTASSQNANAGKPLPPGTKIMWLALPALSSALLTAVTAHITLDLMAVPLLWVGPLALFLVSYIVAFSSWPMRISHLMPALFGLSLLALVVQKTFAGILSQPISLALIAIGFLGVCTWLHHLLFARRPLANTVSQYYLFIAAGGLVGSVITTLIAPLIFTSLIEYPLLLGALFLTHPMMTKALQHWQLQSLAQQGKILLLIGLFFALFYTCFHFAKQSLATSGFLMVFLFTVLGIALYAFRHPTVQGLATGILFVFGLITTLSGSYLLEKRNFFGTIQVSLSPDGKHHILKHGTTIHGVQRLDGGSKSLTPLAYYSEEGPLAQALKLAQQAHSKARIGLVGVGTGALACYARPQEHWSLIDIDADMVKIAENTNYFSYLSDCLPQRDIIIGDARKELEKQKNATFDILILDAFSSDSVPVHLLTREAMHIYKSKLSPDGVIIFHISNKHLDLLPLMRGLSREFEMALAHKAHVTLDQKQLSAYILPTEAVVFFKEDDKKSKILQELGWSLQGQLTPQAWLWTDQASSLFKALRISN